MSEALISLSAFRVSERLRFREKDNASNGIVMSPVEKAVAPFRADWVLA